VIRPVNHLLNLFSLAVFVKLGDVNFGNFLLGVAENVFSALIKNDNVAFTVIGNDCVYRGLDEVCLKVMRF